MHLRPFWWCQDHWKWGLTKRCCNEPLSVSSWGGLTDRPHHFPGLPPLFHEYLCPPIPLTCFVYYFYLNKIFLHEKKYKNHVKKSHLMTSPGQVCICLRICSLLLSSMKESTYGIFSFLLLAFSAPAWNSKLPFSILIVYQKIKI